MELSTWVLLPILFFTMWFFTAHLSTTFPALRNKRICLLIAHPDDEAMFFAPSVLALTNPIHGNHLKILCLSSGNADGLGEVRKKELVQSGLFLGLRDASDVLVLDDPQFPDSMSVTWEAKAISNLLTSTFAPKMAKVPAKSKPETNIDVLITFDKDGVSSHPNHISLYHGAVTFVKSLMQRHSGWEAPVKLYTLPSVNVARKYAGMADVPWTLLGNLVRKKQAGDYPTPLLYVNSVFQYRTAQRAMTTAHKSQMVWFRYGWIWNSRYMIVNDLQRDPAV